MFRSISNLPIFPRLFPALILAALLPGLVIFVLGSFYIGTLNTRGQALQTSNKAVDLGYQQLGNLQRMNALLGVLFTTTATKNTASATTAATPTIGQPIDDELVSLEGNFNRGSMQYQRDYQLATSATMSTVRSIVLHDNPRLGRDQQMTLDLVLGSGQEWPTYYQAQEQSRLALQGHQSFVTVQLLLDAANAAYAPLEKDWQHLVDLTRSIGDSVAQVGSTQNNVIILGSIIALLSIVIILVIWYIVHRTITQPLRQLATLTKRIATGEISARAKIMGRDEIYMVASSMNTMLDNIVRLIQDAQLQRDNLQAQVEKLVNEVSGVGEGDLRIQAEVTADTLGVLADSFNYMVEELASLIIRVKNVAHEVENSAALILDRMTLLVKSGDIQMQQISDAATGVTRMADSSQQIAKRAQVLYKIAHETRQDVHSGRGSMQQAIEGMGRIRENVEATAEKVHVLGERSREVDEIGVVISSIAHQTNRLALDAAIQAAIAGEEGKSFGAVAADIRRLAERAKNEASMIGRVVRSIREDIAAVAIAMQDTKHETSVGAKLTQEASTTLTSIFSAIERQAGEIATINSMTTQQLQSSSAIVQVMRGVSTSTQQSGDSTHQASQNMERLARLVEQLRASVEAFKLREDMNFYQAATAGTLNPAEKVNGYTMTSTALRTVSGVAQPLGAGMPNTVTPTGFTAPASYPTAPYQQKSTDI